MPKPDKSRSCGKSGARSMLIIVPEFDTPALVGEERLLNDVVPIGSTANFLLAGVAGPLGGAPDMVGRIASRFESAPIML